MPCQEEDVSMEFKRHDKPMAVACKSNLEGKGFCLKTQLDQGDSFLLGSILGEFM